MADETIVRRNKVLDEILLELEYVKQDYRDKDYLENNQKTIEELKQKLANLWLDENKIKREDYPDIYRMAFKAITKNYKPGESPGWGMFEVAQLNPSKYKNIIVNLHTQETEYDSIIEHYYNAKYHETYWKIVQVSIDMS